MIFTQDMQDLIEIMERHEVEYVIVGGFAVNFYGYVRTTHDSNGTYKNIRRPIRL